MKTIVNSDNKMRNNWTNLVQVEAGDKAVRMVEDCHDWFQHHPAGTYLIETQQNETGALRAYFKVSEKFAQKVIQTAEQSVDEAIKMMNCEAA